MKTLPAVLELHHVTSRTVLDVELPELGARAAAIVRTVPAGGGRGNAAIAALRAYSASLLVCSCRAPACEVKLVTADAVSLGIVVTVAGIDEERRRARAAN